MRAWFALTTGRYREVVAAAQAGQDAAPGRSVAVQLSAQEAKAWARMGNQRNVVRRWRTVGSCSTRLPYPEHPDNHFVVDPDKFDFYAMDCYRLIGDDKLAEMHAREIIRKTTNPDGTSDSPMRNAEARLTLGVVAARQRRARPGRQPRARSARDQPPISTVAADGRSGTRRCPAAAIRPRARPSDFHDALIAGSHGAA